MNYDKILKIIEKNNGYVTTSEVVNNGIERRFLTNMVKNGILVRISKGYYGVKNYIPDEYYKIASKSKNVRFSMATALYLHNLSNRNPLIYNVTLPFGYSGILQKQKNVILNFVNRDILDFNNL